MSLLCTHVLLEVNVSYMTAKAVFGMSLTHILVFDWVSNWYKMKSLIALS